MTFEDALGAAEREAFAVLCEATGSVAGRNAFLFLNQYVDAWEFMLQESYQNDASFWAAHKHPAMPWNAVATCRFRTPDDCRRWAGKIIRALPITQPRGNLQQFRVDRVEAPGFDSFAPPRQQTELLVWTMSIDFNLVILTRDEA